MIGGLISFIVWMLVVGILYLLAVWVLDSVPVPDPANRIVKMALAVIICLVAILLLLNIVGMGPTGMNLPQIKVQ